MAKQEGNQENTEVAMTEEEKAAALEAERNEKRARRKEAWEKHKYSVLFLFVVIACGASIAISLVHKNDASQLVQDVQMLKSQVANINAQMTQKFDEMSKIYVFSMEETVLSLGMLDKKKIFEQRVNKLTEEVRAAERKLKSIKDAAVRSEYSEVYMKSLQIKRNNLIKDYEKEMKELTTRINKVLEEIVSEQNIPAVFSAKNIAVTTPNVIDITPDLIKKLQEPAKPEPEPEPEPESESDEEEEDSEE